MRRVVSLVFGILCIAARAVPAQQVSAPFTLSQVLDYPYPSELVAAPSGAAIAWVLNAGGVRNIWAASAFENWTPHRLTKYSEDDGQELTNLAFMPDGKTIVYVRGGDHDANWPAEGGLAPDPASNPEQPKMAIWAIELSGGTPRFLAEGDGPVVSPRNDRIAFVKDDQVWAVSFFSSRPAAQLFFSRGKNGSPVWSPDGSQLAFVSDRGDHSFIGVFQSDTEPVRYLAPSTGRDFFPRWSPDGKQIAFVRMPGEGGAPEPMLVNVPAPWSIWVADAATRAGKQVWTSPKTLHGSYPETAGEANLNWGADDRLIFLADLDGWSHLYSIPVAGGAPLLLTPGAFMVEHVAIAPDHRFLVYSANTGANANDSERRHLFRVPVDRAAPVAVTSGDGLEWTPVITNDASTIGCISAGPERPPVPATVPVAGGQPKLLGLDQVPADYPSASFVVPRAVAFRAPDGTMIHGTLFERPGVSGKHAAVVFVHGGPPRQMLLGWHYMDYYSNAYAVNQYLASRGFVVLSVNYRLGIGYGHDFHHPEHAGPAGAAEYQDVLAGGRYLAGLPEVDRARVGIWGGSYGGFLTAMALARNSDVFATGVDLHGVHDWTDRMGDGPGRVERGDWDSARVVAWRSSPVASIKTWKSPVLLIHGDDDRNVRFHQTVDLARRLDAAGVRYEELVLPDEIHGFLRHGSWRTADSATVAYLGRVLREGP
jgi:dipeptidyl aminopeptidase/acylaminoacyl peptidase